MECTYLHIHTYAHTHAHTHTQTCAYLWMHAENRCLYQLWLSQPKKMLSSLLPTIVYTPHRYMTCAWDCCNQLYGVYMSCMRVYIYNICNEKEAEKMKMEPACELRLVVRQLLTELTSLNAALATLPSLILYSPAIATLFNATWPRLLQSIASCGNSETPAIPRS